jgi:hypothetical protein
VFIYLNIVFSIEVYDFLEQNVITIWKYNACYTSYKQQSSCSCGKVRTGQTDCCIFMSLWTHLWHRWPANAEHSVVMSLTNHKSEQTSTNTVQAQSEKPSQHSNMQRILTSATDIHWLHFGVIPFLHPTSWTPQASPPASIQHRRLIH